MIEVCQNKRQNSPIMSGYFAVLRSSDPAEVRTQDPQIKSLLLYQLSYGVR